MKTHGTGTKKFRSIPRTWSALTAMYPLRPIHDAVDLDNATEIIDAMAGHRLNTDQEDYLDALSTLVEAYEREQHPVKSEIRGIDALRALLEENELNASDLARLLGVHRSAGSKILRGERSLTTHHIRALSQHFRVNPALLLD